MDKIEKLLTDNKELFIVCDEELKKIILKNYLSNKILNVKFSSLTNLINDLTFSYKEEAIYQLMKKYNYEYDVCKLYLSNLKYTLLDRNKLNDQEKQKLDVLDNIYNYLFQNNLLIIKKGFKEYLSKKKVIFLDCHLKKEDKIFLSDLNYEEVQTTSFSCKRKLKACVCNDFEEELFWMFENICNLLYNKVKTDDIKIVYNPSDKDELFRRMSSLFKVFVNGIDNISLSEIPIVNSYLENKIQNVNDLPNSYKEVLMQINDPLKDDDKYIIYLKAKYKNIYLKSNYQDAIDIINIKDIKYFKNKYIFVLRCNEGLLYSLSKDEDYLKDSTKEKMNIDTSICENVYKRKLLYEGFYSDNHIFLSLSKHDKKDEIYQETFLSDENVLLEPFAIDYSEYSDEYNRILLCKALDDYYIYGIKRKGLSKLLSTYDISYGKYDHKMKGLELKHIYEKLNGNLNLSYTKIDSFYKCPFSYYIKYILKLDSMLDDSFMLFVGSLYHYVLSKAFSEGFCFEDCVNDFIENKYLDKNIDEKILMNRQKIIDNKKNKFLLTKLKEELKSVILEINKQNNYILYDKQEYEKEINVIDEVKVNGQNFITKFTGMIDKIYYKEENNKRYLAIVDYKTGKEDFKFDLVKYGLKLQLPTYLYLINNAKEFKNSFIYGFYIQNILNNEISAKTELEYENNKSKALKLKGFSIDLFPEEGRFDATLSSSEVISGMKLTKDGKYNKQSSKVLSEDEINNLYVMAKEKIDEASRNILKGLFPIKPKVSKDVNSCQYCKFKDICFMEEKDIERIESGGENNGVDE